jgi:hypothetical protein
MSTNNRKFYLCCGHVVEYDELYKFPKSHILGELRYVTDEERRVTGLAIYEKSVSATLVPPLKPDIRLVVVGDARQIRCTHPGCERKDRWEIGRAAFLALVQRYEKEMLEKDDGGNAPAVERKEG